MRHWKKILIPYEQAVEELKVKFKAIRNELREMSEYSPIEFVTGRVKKVSSILEKAKKYGIAEEEIEEKIEDIAGIRIMCQFVDDIYKVVELIEQRDGKDLKIAYVKDYIKNRKESGYRSYHIIIKYPIQTAFGYKEILAEIQIRTLAMNFWATIEHSINYKYKKNVPEHIKERLKKAAEAAYLLDKEMWAVRDEVINAQKLFEAKSNTVSSIVNNIQLLRSTGKTDTAKKFQEKFDKALEKGNMIKLKELSDSIKYAVDKYQAFE
ncbi:GTP pyrophosphokinase family protein [Crassaminicella thermophila]|uniref:GTP pyrophosphokinase family protein n=1 Tax=Crassaminicella thermophila TaxID=2599308 RepID=A0A5C0SGI5_CRATE|nr:GTP pyrophosphokinase family protein [Crassaminicella thermophila]QEK12767.1 GTP pyrophosphokinase family protein [Crassaminicella thermophila]